MFMSLTILAVYCTLAASLMRAVLVKLQIVAPTCSGCGLPRERRVLGEQICSCAHTA
jgi:hypothetical protein